MALSRINQHLKLKIAAEATSLILMCHPLQSLNPKRIILLLTNRSLEVLLKIISMVIEYLKMEGKIFNKQYSPDNHQQKENKLRYLRIKYFWHQAWLQH